MANLKPSELLSRLEGRKARSQCEVCGSNEWLVAGDKTAQVVQLSLQDEPASGLRIGGQSIPVFLNICTNCGNVRAHAVGVIAPELMNSDG